MTDLIRKLFAEVKNKTGMIVFVRGRNSLGLDESRLQVKRSFSICFIVTSYTTQSQVRLFGSMEAVL